MLNWLENYFKVRLDKHFEKKYSRVYMPDTYSLIDGRIIGFLKQRGVDGRVVLISTVLLQLKEMQKSSNTVVATNGRRGANVAEDLKRILYENGKEVEYITTGKTVINVAKYAFEHGFGEGIVVTTNDETTKLCKAHEVKVVNIAELAQDLNENLFRGDKFLVKLTKLGDEQGQAIGYYRNHLTVVKNGAKYVGQNVPVIIDRVFPLKNGERILFTTLQWDAKE